MRSIALLVAGGAFAVCAAVGATAEDVVIETPRFRLTVGPDARPKSLVVRSSGEECLETTGGEPLFSVTQDRPFNNENKLAHPNKRTTYPANRLRRDGDLLHVGFETAAYEAIVRVRTGTGYAAFELVDFRCDPEDERQYRNLKMDVPPVDVFRVAQLPVRDRTQFGEWVNAVWDERAAAGVMGLDPLVYVDAEERRGYRLLRADLKAGLKLRGGAAAIVAGAGEGEFLSGIEELERDWKLPPGVANRRDPRMNASILWAGDLTPKTVDRYIDLAKRGGFRMMLVYYSALVKGGREHGYGVLGDYDLSDDFPNGISDVREMLEKLRREGITVGLHTLQTHIGLKSRYVTPVADARLNKKRLFRLARAIPEEGRVDEIFVDENPVDSPRHEKCRILQFDGELFSYEDYVTTWPYRFTGVVRGVKDTRAAAHAVGAFGGVLDVCEYGAQSCYIDQRTSLQDEIARKIATICDAGMEFCYFDGSEGVNPPCGIHVALSQYRVVSAFSRPPLFTEGAAKSHFSWHLQAGANAFDLFRPEVFKEKLAEHPLAEAPVMRQNFTRVDFGWWGFFFPVGPEGDKDGRPPTVGAQPDMWEYGTSKAAAWDCPATVQAYLADIDRHPRANDLFETMRRWEDVRARNLLTARQKELLKDPKREYHLVPNATGAYDLVGWRQLPVAGGLWTDVRAFVHEANGRRVITYWHVRGKGRLVLPDGRALEASDMRTFESALLEDGLGELLMRATIE